MIAEVKKANEISKVITHVHYQAQLQSVYAQDHLMKVCNVSVCMAL